MSQTKETPLAVEASNQIATPNSQLVNTGQSSQEMASGKMKKRKEIKPRSEVWTHFTKTMGDDRDQKGKCNYCDMLIAANPIRNGTTAMKNHLKVCKEHPYAKKEDSKQTILCGLAGGEEEVEKKDTLGNWRYDQEVVRKSLAYWVVVDELPFKAVEGKGFRQLMKAVQPRFRVPLRFTVSRDCYQLYLDEKKRLKLMFKAYNGRIALTTDTWTSMQKVNYMSLTAHYIDNEWKLNKKILNFCPITSHRGKDIGKAIEMCLLEWRIENVFTLTVDNATSNDATIDYLKEKMNNWGTAICRGKYVHMRCIAHILNLMVNDGLKHISNSIKKVRAAVRYIRQSPVRLDRFKKCVEIEKIQSNSMLCLDVPTRWNSTYIMLDVAQKFEKAFDRYDELDPHYSRDLVGEFGEDWQPKRADWEKVRKVSSMLKHFYDLTLKVSGSKYVTSNILFHELFSVHCLLREWEIAGDIETSEMALRMRDKFEKYWGDVEKMNKLIYITVVLDPRHKLDFVGFALIEMYGNEKGARLKEQVQEVVLEMYNDYKRIYGPPSEEHNSSSKAESSCSYTSGSTDPMVIIKQRYKKYKSESAPMDTRTDLDKYLNEEEEEEDIEGFDILGWWQKNEHRFPILSQMARDVYAVPISTVASESAFSTGGRVLDAFRSSLTPKVVQSLVCAQDWLRNSLEPINVEESISDMEKLEIELGQIGVLDEATPTPIS